MKEIGIVLTLSKLNDGSKNEDKYPSLKTKESTAIDWWNSLDKNNKINVGSLAIHYNLMTANFPWNCFSGERGCFDNLSRNQKRIVKYLFTKRNVMWEMIPLETIFKV